MAKYRHLDNAPITEAIIDLRVKLPSEFQVKEFSRLRDVLRDRYPDFQERRLITGGFEIQAGKRVMQALEDKGIDGYVLTSTDRKQVAQFRKEGFTFSRLKPYTDWEGVLAEAKSVWKVYEAEASPELVTRIAVRYINHLSVPLSLPTPIDAFARYLTAPPNTPGTLRQVVSHFLARVVVHDIELGTTANITQALQKSPQPDQVTIILDIDVFEQKETGFDEGDIWARFEQLRDVKNRVFFDSITEETARLYE